MTVGYLSRREKLVDRVIVTESIVAVEPIKLYDEQKDVRRTTIQSSRGINFTFNLPQKVSV